MSDEPISWEQAPNGGESIGGRPSWGAVDAETFFERKPKQIIHVLGGIPVDLTVRVYEVEGHITIKGDIPDDALVLAKRGCVTVEGYALGHILASGDISVKQNVQGVWLISVRGDVRVRNVLRGAKLVAQMGRVQCAAVESPDLLYGRLGVSVEGEARGGILKGRSISIGGSAIGVEIHAVASVRSERFMLGPGGSSTVYLCKALTSEAYGRPISGEALKLKLAITRDRLRLVSLTKSEMRASTDVHNCTRTMLYYMLVGAETMQYVRELRGAQTQLIFLEQIMDLALSLSSQLNEAATNPTEEQIRTAQIAVEEAVDNAKSLSDSIGWIPQEFRLYCEAVLSIAVRQLTTILERVSYAASTAQRAFRESQPLEEHITAFGKCAEVLEQQVLVWKEKNDEALKGKLVLLQRLSLDSALMERIENNGSGLEEMLELVLAQARRKHNSKQAERANSAFIRLMQSAIERHTRDTQRMRREMTAIENHIREIQSELNREPSILLVDPDGELPYIESRFFEKGIVLSTAPGEREPAAPDEAPIICVAYDVRNPARFSLQGTILRGAPIDSA